MTEANVAEQKQIFDAPLDSQEQAAIDALLAKHKHNAALTQQLALDASRLVTTSQDRLIKQKDAGFFKRIANAISGKTGENQLQNQMDMLQVQRFSWHYLQQLQQQNLINAQSIAVIRNNLGTMNEYIIETRDFLEQAVGKIHSRLQRVENNTDFNNWALNVEANKRRFKAIPKGLLILRLTYDFLGKNQHVMLTEQDVSNYLVTTLEKLDINCDEEIRLLDFVSELIDQIELTGIEQYRATIELSFDGHTVDLDFIQKNISGIGFNALYFLAGHYERIAAMIGDDELCNSDEAREKLISKFFGNELSGLSATYSVRDLICEIIGGAQVSIDVYKDMHGLNTVEADVEEAFEPEVVKLVSSMPDIKAHTFLDTSNEEAKRDYLLLLALCVENAASLNEPAREFIALLAQKAGLPDLHREVMRIADNPRKQFEYQSVMQTLLDNDDKKYTWLLDAFFLLTLAQKPIENPQIKVILGVLKPTQLKECLPNLLVIVTASDDAQVLDAAIKSKAYARGWKNVVRYREMRFDKHFAETRKRLDAASWAVTRLLLDLSDIYSKGMEHSVFFTMSDGGLLSSFADKAAAGICSMGRSSTMSGLNEFRKKASDLMSEHRSALYQANGEIARWNMPSFEYKDEIGFSSFDLNNSSDNEDWGDQFQDYYNRVDKTLNAFSNACEDAAEQLGFLIKGDFDHSVAKAKEQKRLEWLSKQKLEQLEKQSVTIVKDGQEHLFSIEWQKVEHPPCTPEQIRHIRTDGKIWLVVADIDSKDLFYRSEDGVHWQNVQLDIPSMQVCVGDIQHVNGMWIVRNGTLSEGTREDGIYYSSDALDWRHTSVPNAAGNRGLSLNQGFITYKNLIHFNGVWLWAATQYQKYNYVEKGFFSDSTKTNSYAKLILFRADTLEGPWDRWDQSPQLSEGVSIESIGALPGRNALLAFCKYAYSYVRDKKRPETPPFVMYYGAAKSWQSCDWAGETRYTYYKTPPVFAEMGNELLHVGSEILASEKGYDWTVRAPKVSADEHFTLPGLSLFTSKGNASVIYVSQDGKTFSELLLEDGRWSHLAANEQGILGVHYANRHEETMLRIGRYISMAKA
jgi:hypothetical protein